MLRRDALMGVGDAAVGGAAGLSIWTGGVMSPETRAVSTNHCVWVSRRKPPPVTTILTPPPR